MKMEKRRKNEKTNGVNLQAPGRWKKGRNKTTLGDRIGAVMGRRKKDKKNKNVVFSYYNII